MIFLRRKKLGIILVFSALILLGGFHFGKTAYSDTCVPSAQEQECREQNLDCDQCVNYLINKVASLQGQADTLSSQISIMDNQINLTQARIEATEEQITNLILDIDTTTKKISGLEKSLDTLAGILINRIIATYEVGTIQPMQILLTSTDVTNFLSRLNYLRLAQESDKKLIYSTQQAKNDYSNQKDIFEAKKKQVETLRIQLLAYTNQINQQKQTEQQLLSDTQGSETIYQSLLSQAKAQLAGFSSFTSGMGGASILSNQTVCDGWGCYYNQRDSQWGNDALNNTQFTIASDGCLLTSMAMIYTHYGHRSVTPVSINSNSDNFASYYPAYLKYTITADGATSQRVGSIIDSTLSSGNPVVVGISYDGGPTPDHFVVLVSGSNGSYVMNDPFVPNGHEISFTDHYSVGAIREIDKVVF